MKIHEVPQDQDPSYQGGKRLCYAVDEQGRYVHAFSSGWYAEETVKGLAWKAIEKELEEIRARLRLGLVSPLYYFMRVRQMDPGLLAENMGVSSWRVRWHLRVRTFAKLNSEWLRRYSECLDIPVEALRGFKG